MFGFGFQISEDDVAAVLVTNLLDLNVPGDVEEIAEDAFEALDHDSIESAALMGDDIDEQTDYAHAEIERQLRESGVLAHKLFPKS